MTNVIHLSKLPENQAHCSPSAPPTLDQLLETRDLLAEGMRSLGHMQMLLEGLIVTTLASEEQGDPPDALAPTGPGRL